LFVVQKLLNMFRALLCPSSGARQTAVTASGFRMNVEVEVFSAVAENTETCWAVSLRQSNKILLLIVACSWVFYLSELDMISERLINYSTI